MFSCAWHHCMSSCSFHHLHVSSGLAPVASAQDYACYRCKFPSLGTGYMFSSARHHCIASSLSISCMLPRVLHWFHVFLCLASLHVFLTQHQLHVTSGLALVSRFPVPGIIACFPRSASVACYFGFCIGCMFFCAWHHCMFPWYGISYMLPQIWHWMYVVCACNQLHVSSGLATVACFPVLGTSRKFSHTFGTPSQCLQLDHS